jgi:hypothetical protein
MVKNYYRPAIMMSYSVPEIPGTSTESIDVCTAITSMNEKVVIWFQ